MQLTDPTARDSLRTSPSDGRPGLAILANVITPYRANLHRLIAAGIPELRLHTLITHGVGDFKWAVNVPPEVNISNFSIAGEHSLDNPMRRPVGELRKAARIIRHLKAHNVQAVVFTFYRYLSYLRVMDYCYRSGIPFWVNLDSNIRSEAEPSKLQGFVKQSIYSWWLKRAAGVLPMGKLGDQYFIKYGADPKRIYRFPCWPDFDAFSRVDKVQLERFQRKFGLRNDRQYILFSGRLAPEKRVDLLIDAYAAIARNRPNWDLLIVGDGPLRESLQGRMTEEIKNRVVWTGFLDGDEPILAYHSAQLLVLPSDWEPWALVVQEAMAAGLPVIASDVVAAAHELVTDRVSGRIFPKGDVKALRDALDDLTQQDHTETYKKQAVAALQHYRETVNPVAELRRALTDGGVLGHAAAATSNA